MRLCVVSLCERRAPLPSGAASADGACAAAGMRSMLQQKPDAGMVIGVCNRSHVHMHTHTHIHTRYSST
jgi:hypothetical protein